ncbi:MAG: adenosylhomocysteinase [Geodermatophilaceae bacterium]|nr:adenosylhomocysteinase [Geodermatophilaceae bacterium]MDQ3466124.1 adenosylhomocysteinase [Actinomycetota bacterium]
MSTAEESLSDQGLLRLVWAQRAMPALAQIKERFERDRPLDGLRVVAALHVTPETANLMLVLKAGGAHLHLAAANPLSTQDDIAAALVHRFGIDVHARRGADRVTYDRHLELALAAAPQLVLDDGCDLVGRLHTTHRDLLPDVRGGCEQTTTGVLRLRAMAAESALSFPVVAVNDSRIQQSFANRHGTGQSTVDAIIRSTNVLLAGRTVVVAGYGNCGKGVADRARGLGASVIVTEVDPARALEAVMAGFRVLPMREAAAEGDVFVTVTGSRGVLAEPHFATMKDNAILANSGHFDLEIDVAWLRARCVDMRAGIRPHVDEYLMADGRRLLVLAEGRLVNLAAAEGHPPAVMDMSFAGQALCVEWLAINAAALLPGVYDVPAEIDYGLAMLQLAAMGVRIDTLDPAQEAYLTSWRNGG